MPCGEHIGYSVRVTRAITRVRIATLAAVALFAAGWFTIGIRLALGWGLGWIDSGLVVYGGWRITQGAVPYRDFDHVYGPSLFYLNAALLGLFGADLAVVSASLLVLKVGLVVLVFVLAQRVASLAVALTTTALLVVVWGSPLWLFSSPYAQHYGTVCALIALVVAATGRPTRRALAIAGLWVGVAATFKITSGLFGLFALVLWRLAETAPPHGATTDRRVGVRILRIGAACAALALGVLYGLGSLPAVASVAGVVTVTVVVLPFAALAATVLRDELRGASDADVDARGAIDVVVVTAAAAAPLLAWLGFFAANGAGAAALRDILALPPALRWFEPLPMPSAMAVLAVVVAVLAGMRRWPVVAVVATLGLIALMAAGRPPATGWGTHLGRHALGRIAFDVVGYLPLLSVILAAPRVRSLAPVPRLYLLFAASNLLLLLPAADVWHGFLTLPTALPLTAVVLGAVPGTVPVAMLALLMVPFVVQLETARRSWRTATATFTRASGITHPDPKFDDVAALVRHLDAGPGRDRPLLLLTAEAMIYFLAGRPSAFEHEEYLMQTLVRGAASPESTALLTDDADFARRLETERPLLVDETSGPARAALRRFLPRSAAVIDGYQPAATFGRYVVLDR